MLAIPQLMAWTLDTSSHFISCEVSFLDFKILPKLLLVTLPFDFCQAGLSLCCMVNHSTALRCLMVIFRLLRKCESALSGSPKQWTVIFVIEFDWKYLYNFRMLFLKVLPGHLFSITLNLIMASWHHFFSHFALFGSWGFVVVGCDVWFPLFYRCCHSCKRALDPLCPSVVPSSSLVDQ